jgi:hypothetical protein
LFFVAREDGMPDIRVIAVVAGGAALGGVFRLMVTQLVTAW